MRILHGEMLHLLEALLGHGTHVVLWWHAGVGAHCLLLLHMRSHVVVWMWMLMLIMHQHLLRGRTIHAGGDRVLAMLDVEGAGVERHGGIVVRQVLVRMLWWLWLLLRARLKSGSYTNGLETRTGIS